MKAALLTDEHTNGPQGPMNTLVRSLISRLDNAVTIQAKDEYYDAAVQITELQTSIDCIILFVRSRVLFRHPGLFHSWVKPVIVVDHDACQNSIPGGSQFGAWTEFFSGNPVAALCVSGKKAYRDLAGSIPTRVVLLPKAAPEDFLRYAYSRAGRFCIYGSIQPTATYHHRASVYDAIRRHTTYDRIIRRFGLYRTSYFLSLLFRTHPEISRIDFDSPQMKHVLRYYSAAIMCDRGLGEPMMKHFEASALGLAVFRDDEVEEELTDYGYKDAQSMVIYQDLEDLREKIQWYSRHLSALNAIQQKARETTKNHTWEIRAEQLLTLIHREILA